MEKRKGIVDDGYKSERDVAAVSDVIRSLGSSSLRPITQPRLFGPEQLEIDYEDPTTMGERGPWELFMEHINQEPRP